MPEQFLHGTDVVEIDDGARPIKTVKSSVIGLIGTAPEADAVKFPLNVPVLIAGKRTEAAKLGSTGTLPAAMDGIFDQTGAMVVVVRVEEGTDLAATLSNLVGGVDPDTGAYLGVQCFLGAESKIHVSPKILIAPGFTASRPTGVAAIEVTEGGTGYVTPIAVTLSGGGGSGASARAVVGEGGVRSIQVITQGRGYTSAPTVTITDGGGSGATATAVVEGGKVKAITVTNPGSGFAAPLTVSITGGGGRDAVATATVAGGAITAITLTRGGWGYTAAPTVTLTGGGGTDATATATIASLANPVVAELLGIAERLRAVIIADGPGTTDEDAITYRRDWGSRRVYVVDPPVLVWDTVTSMAVAQPASPRVAGLIAKIDNERGFWWSPSNNVLNGVIGVTRDVDFTLWDPNCRANYLNENEVATVIREDGYRLWGNRTCSDDAKWAFLNVVRTADIIHESLLRAHRWAVDRNITKGYFEAVTGGVNDYLRHLVAIGAILGGRCWADPELNTPDQLQAGKVYFDFDFTAAAPAEHVTFRSHMVNDYYQEIFK